MNTAEINNKRHEDLVKGQEKILDTLNYKEEEVRQYYIGQIESLKKEKEIEENKRRIAEGKVDELLNRVDEYKKSSNTILQKSFRLFIEKDLNSALKLLDENIEQFSKGGDLDKLSEFYRLKGDFLITQLKIREALVAFEKIAELNPTAFNLINFGVVLYNSNQLEKADTYFDRALDILELNPHDDKGIIVENIYNMSAAVKLQLGNREKARDRIEHGLNLMNKTKILSKEEIFRLYTLKVNQGMHSYHNRELGKAFAEIILSNTILEKIFDSSIPEHIKSLANNFINLSNIKRELGEFKDALELVNEGEKIFFSNGQEYAITNFPLELLMVLYTKGIILKELNDLDSSEDFLNRALIFSRQFKKYNPRQYEQLEARILIGLGDTLETKKLKGKAKVFFEESLKIYQKLSVLENSRFKQEIQMIKEKLKQYN